MQHLFSVWQKVLARIDEAKHILLLCDFDGTLTPIVSRPELAYIPEQTQKTLQKLAQSPEYTVGIVSGRSLDDLKDRVKVPGIIYAGNYGLEIESPEFSSVNPEADRSRKLLDNLYQELCLGLADINGVILENKRLTLSVHYRLINDKDCDRFNKTFEQIIYTVSNEGKIEVTPGKKVYEIKPAISWHKGKILEVLLGENTGGKGTTLPFFLGDDISDEAGFEAVDKYDGISILVGEESSQSKGMYYLISPTEVEEFLEMLLSVRGYNNR